MEYNTSLEKAQNFYEFKEEVTMAKQIPDEFLDQLRAIPIEEVASLYFDLTQIGAILQTSCTHGGDNDPSLTFFPQTNTFYCFGCGAGKRPKTEGSSVIDFVMWMDKCKFTEAVAKLANLKGLEVPREGLSPEEKRKQQMMAQAVGQNRLYWQHLQGEERALSYLHERGIDENEINKWRLGYVPEDARTPHAGKVVFSLMNDWGQTVGFSHRDMTKEFTGEKAQGPKYINSAKSPIFDKGKILYGLHFVKRLIREKGYVVVGEGFGDTILGQKLGLPFVSIMGTSMTEQHIRILKEYTDTVILWMDGDTGGITATQRHAKALKDEGFTVKIVNYFGKDPDDIFFDIINTIPEEDQIAHTEKLLHAESILDSQFYINRVLERLESEMSAIQLRAVKEIKPVLDDIEDKGELAIYKRQVARRLGVDISDLS